MSHNRLRRFRVQLVLEDAHRRASNDDVDPNSPMEGKVLDWLYKTPFFQRNSQLVEIIPQFEIGAYLKQLDPLYQHPAWRVDFLIIYQSPKGPLHIVVEYDGFEYHFQKGKAVHIGNHDRYLHEADIARQLQLESYGYRFLSLNRFNLGSDPVQTISDRLYALLELALGEPVSQAVETIQAQASGLASRELRTCPKCGEIKEIAEFFDPALRNGEGGTGRNCMTCKSASTTPRTDPRPRFRRKRWR